MLSNNVMVISNYYYDYIFYIQIKQVPIDPMHTIDGGVIVDFIGRIFDIRNNADVKNSRKNVKNTKPGEYVPPYYYRMRKGDIVLAVNSVINEWSSKSMPYEMARKVRDLGAFSFWKMIEAQHFFKYMSLTLFDLLRPSLMDFGLPSAVFTMVNDLAIAVTLLGGHSHVPIPEVCIPRLYLNWSLHQFYICTSYPCYILYYFLFF